MEKRFGKAFTTLPIEEVGAKSDFMEAFEKIKRSWKGRGRAKNVYKLPLKMKLLDEEEEKHHVYYDFFTFKVKINRLVPCPRSCLTRSNRLRAAADCSQ
jgi:hypothetical protein